MPLGTTITNFLILIASNFHKCNFLVGVSQSGLPQSGEAWRRIKQAHGLASTRWHWQEPSIGHVRST